jgi:hypothetical protein
MAVKVAADFTFDVNTIDKEWIYPPDNSPKVCIRPIFSLTYINLQIVPGVGGLEGGVTVSPNSMTV